MVTFRELNERLRDIDRGSYGGYKSIRGSWTDGAVTLHVDHVQSDPFASPSRMRLTIPQKQHGIPQERWSTPCRRIALCDLLLRRFAWAAEGIPRAGGSGKSGMVSVDAGDAEILARSACALYDDHLELRFRVGLPARGRSVMGKAASELLTRHLREAANEIRWDALDPEAVRNWVELAEDHDHLQKLLPERGLVAFVRDGSILPRKTGVSSRPLPHAVPFESPDSLRVTLPTLHHGEVVGMGIPEGVTLVTGGGFHGKTTLLEAIQNGVYPHIPDDGREWVVTRKDAVKVRSEDGRSVAGVDLSGFIRNLPGRQSTDIFTTQDASGSTSLAASIVESIEAGSQFLLLDEDTCATNLLIRDARMQDLVQRETIVPLVDRVRELSSELGVSTLLVLGGSGDYLDVADLVLLMEDFLPHEATERAKAIAAYRPTGRDTGRVLEPLKVTQRSPEARSFDPRKGNREKVRSRGLRELLYGEETVDLSSLEQLVDDSQARAIGVLMKRLGEVAGHGQSLRQVLGEVLDQACVEGLFRLDPVPDLAMPRPYEVAAAINRLRSLHVHPVHG